MSLRNAVAFAQHILLPYVQQANCLVDATAGNGYDTLYLAKNSPVSAKVWAFDLQSLAIEATKKRLQAEALAHKVTCLVESHENIGQVLPSNERIDVAMFNLGYLPTGNHHFTTKADTTIKALQNLMPYIGQNGIVSIAAYPGHEEGRREAQALHTFLAELDQKKYHVAKLQMLNQIHEPPVLFLLQKRRSENCERFASYKN